MTVNRKTINISEDDLTANNLVPVTRPPWKMQLVGYAPDFALSLFILLICLYAAPQWPGTIYLVVGSLNVAPVKFLITVASRWRQHAQQRDFLYIRHFESKATTDLQWKVSTALKPHYGMIALLPPPKSKIEHYDEVAKIRSAPPFTVRTKDDRRWHESVQFLAERTHGTIIEASEFTESLEWETKTALAVRDQGSLLVVAKSTSVLDNHPGFRRWWRRQAVAKMEKNIKTLKKGRERLEMGEDFSVSPEAFGKGMAFASLKPFGLNEFLKRVKEWAREHLPLDSDEIRRRKSLRLPLHLTNVAITVFVLLFIWEMWRLGQVGGVGTPVITVAGLAIYQISTYRGVKWLKQRCAC